MFALAQWHALSQGVGVTEKYQNYKTSIITKINLETKQKIKRTVLSFLLLYAIGPLWNKNKH